MDDKLTPEQIATALLSGADYCRKKYMPKSGSRCGACIAVAIRDAVEAERATIIDHLNGKKGIFINRDFVVEHIRARSKVTP